MRDFKIKHISIFWLSWSNVNYWTDAPVLYSWWRWYKVLIAVIKINEIAGNKFHTFSQRYQFVFPYINFRNGFLRVCVWLEVVFRQNMSVRRAMAFWLTQEWHISIFLRVIQEILLIRKNKEIVLSKQFRPLHGFRELKKIVRIEYKISMSSSGGLRCFYYACFSNAWIIFINFNIFRFLV